MGLIDDMLKKNEGEEEKKDLIDRLQEKEKAAAEAKEKREHPYAIIKPFLIFYVALPLALVYLTTIFVLDGKESVGVVTLMYSTLVYLYSLHWMVIQEILNNITFLIGLEPIIIPLETICYYPLVFGGETIEMSQIIYSINPIEFRDNLVSALDTVFSSQYKGTANDAFRKTVGLFGLTIVQSYLGILLIYHTIKLFTKKRAKKTSAELASEWEKIIEDPSKKEEAEKLKDQIIAQKGIEDKMDLREAYKTFFKHIDPKGTALLDGTLNGKVVVKKGFYKLITEAFNENLPDKYYNIINFLAEEDKKLFNFKERKNGDTKALKEYSPKEFEKYKSKFNVLNGHLMMPVMLARLRSYRTYDIHNLITIAKNNPEEYFMENCTKDEINKIQRMSKEGYKLFHNPRENQDSTRFSVELRYPYSFTISEIDKLEEIREDIKEMNRKLILKYLSSDENMRIYSIESDEINEEAYRYFNDDYNEYVKKILAYNEQFFETLKNGNRHTWINNQEGIDLKRYMIRLINLNFNPNLFLKEIRELNSSHFKSLYFVEESITLEDKEELKKIITSTEIDLSIYIREHTPINGILFLAKRNLGYFRMLSIAQDLLGTISDENKINSFLDEFKMEYTRLK